VREDMHPKEGAPYVAKTSRVSPNNTVYQIREADPDITRAKGWREFMAAFRADEDLQEACARAAFTNAWTNYDRLLDGRKARAEAEETVVETKRSRRAKMKTEAAFNARLLQECILDLVVFDGKPMRHWTGKEVRQRGRGFERIAERVKPNEIVGEVLNDAEADRLMRV
jgi:hypothetical protein